MTQGRVHTLLSAALCALALACVYGCPGRAAAQWRWTPAAAHHDACVEVSVPGAGGSGTLIWTGEGRGLVLTAEHVVRGERQAQARWRNGYASSGPIVSADPGADLALFEVTPPAGACAIPIAEADPNRQTMVEVLGYGVGRAGRTGPGTLRHFAGQVLGYGPDYDTPARRVLHVGAYVISGDSGGPILTGSPPAVCGVVKGGSQITEAPHASLVHPAEGSCAARIREFLSRCAPRALGQCRPGRTCPPLVLPGPQVAPPAPHAAPPALQPPPPLEPPASVPPTSEAIERRLEQIEQGLRRDREALESRLAELLAKHLAGSQGAASITLALAAKSFALGGPVGLGVFAAGWLLARSWRRGRLIHVTGGVSEAPPDDPFPAELARSEPRGDPDAPHDAHPHSE